MLDPTSDDKSLEQAPPNTQTSEHQSTSPVDSTSTTSQHFSAVLSSFNNLQLTTPPAALVSNPNPPEQKNPLIVDMLAQFKQVTKRAHKVEPRDLKKLEAFLTRVAEGDQETAEVMLRQNPTLALVSGNVTDLSNRTFNGITGFQYAVWALDWHMWTMIRKYLSDDAAREQAQGFETGSWVEIHGVHANLNALIQAYKSTSALYNAERYDESKAQGQEIAVAQLLLPAHVVNEYCHPTRPFYPLPNFQDTLPLPRSRAIHEGEWFSISRVHKGETQIVCRGGRLRPDLRSVAYGRSQRDLDACRGLVCTRTFQREALINELMLKSTASHANQKDIEAFLKLVAEGEQNKAEVMLKKSPTLALISGNVTDLSHRTFNGITGFQYAVWALDWHMWRMIRKYLPHDAAREQAKGFETGTWVEIHGVHANLNTLIQAYKATHALYEQKQYAKGNEAWVKQVGEAQRLLPAHVVNEYCHPTRSFYPVPNFQDAVALPRSRTIAEADWFTASYNGGQLGEKFACLRDRWGMGRRRSGAAGESVEDYKSICVLTATRTAQRQALTAELRPRSAQRNAI